MNADQSIITKKNRIIYFLSLFLVIALLLLFRYQVHDLFALSPPPYAQGDSVYNIYQKSYRWKLFGSRKPYGTWYDTGSFKKYIDSTVPALISNMKGRKDYKWGVGFYYMRKKMPDGSKSWDFCMIPTLKGTVGNDTTVLDFFDDTNCYYYNRCNNGPLKGGISGSSYIGYDAGQLWP
jgi:hypothetical protein